MTERMCANANTHSGVILMRPPVSFVLFDHKLVLHTHTLLSFPPAFKPFATERGRQTVTELSVQSTSEEQAKRALCPTLSEKVQWLHWFKPTNIRLDETRILLYEFKVIGIFPLLLIISGCTPKWQTINLFIHKPDSDTRMQQNNLGRCMVSFSNAPFRVVRAGSVFTCKTEAGII